MGELPTHLTEIDFLERLSKRIPKDSDILELLGSLYAKTGQYRKTLRIDKRLAKRHPDNARYHYNLACTLSLVGKKTDAFNALERAIGLGYCDTQWMLQDPDLDSIKSNPRFKSLVHTAAIYSK